MNIREREFNNMQKLFENWRLFTEQEKSNYGYVVGDLDTGEILARKNENRLFYGASMNKPLIALANLIHFRDNPDPEKKLNKKDLEALLAYKGYESNDINRILSGRGPRKPDKQKFIDRYGKEKYEKPYNWALSKYQYALKRKKKIGIITPELAAEYLQKWGLSPDIGIIYGAPNKQSPISYFNFIKFLHTAEKIEGIETEVNIILNHMKRDPLGLGRKDRESKKWETYYKKELNKKGINVQSMYGKGGRTPAGKPKAALNYGFVINNKIILVIYTELDDKKHMLNLMAKLLEGKI